MLFGNNDELKEKIEEKESRIRELEEDIDSLEAQLESSEQKRKKLAREKQGAQEDLNRLEDKLESQKESEQSGEKDKTELQRLSFNKAKQLIQKLDSVEGEDLVTIYSHGEIDMDNYAEKKILDNLNRYKDFVLFTDHGFMDYLIRMRSFYSEEAFSGDNFDTKQLLDFMRLEKIWITVSAGESHIYWEKDGNIEKIGDLKTRIEEKHGKGGFSQGRFERKRDQQIEEFSELVEGKIGELESNNIFLVGEKQVCSRIDPGEYLGGFDSNRKTVDALYQFRFKKLLTESK